PEMHRRHEEVGGTAGARHRRNLRRGPLTAPSRPLRPGHRSQDKEIPMPTLSNPGEPGVVPFDTVVYASAGLGYAAVPGLGQFPIFAAPDPAYVTPRRAISAFAQLGSAPWPFPNTAVPLNGHICIPRGRGPFPLAIFAHGNHNPVENSTPGYLYLCSL